MTQTVKLMQLDFKMVQQHLFGRQGLYLLAIGIGLPFIMRDASFLSGFWGMYGLLYAAYPFMMVEQGGASMLYGVLPVDRAAMIRGRYLYAVSIMGAAALGGLLLGAVLQFVLPESEPVEGIIGVAAVMFLTGCLMVSAQFPIFFRLGYMKARTWAYLPLLLLVPLTTYLSTSGIVGGFETTLSVLMQSPALLLFGVVLCGAVALGVSMAVSLWLVRRGR